MYFLYIQKTLRKDFKNAEKQFRTAIELDKTCADAHNHLGWLLQHSKGGDEAGTNEAEIMFRTAISLDPSYTDAHVKDTYISIINKNTPPCCLFFLLIFIIICYLVYPPSTQPLFSR